MALNQPNFFILGAAKSGTTSLYNYLNQHPGIYLSPVKEPTFFCEEFQIISDPISYFKLFDDVTTERIVGEASHAYLTSPSTPRVLRGLFPSARFVVILRNPADRAFSLYHHMRRSGYEYINSFEKALEAEEERIISSRFRDNCPQYLYNFLYYRSGLYGEQLRRYFEFFERDRFYLLTSDALKRDPRASVEAILRFLELRTDVDLTLNVHNAGVTTVRFPALQYIWRTRVTKPALLRRIMRSLLWRINSCPRPAIDPRTRAALLDRYREDQALLHEISGIQFTV